MKDTSMTFAELYAACASRLQGRVWRLQVQAATWLPPGEVMWEIYVDKLHIPFSSGKRPEIALAALDAALATEGFSEPQHVSEIGKIEVNP